MTITPLAGTPGSKRYQIHDGTSWATAVGPATGTGGMVIVTSQHGGVTGHPLQRGEFFGLSWVERHFGGEL